MMLQPQALEKSRWPRAWLCPLMLQGAECHPPSSEAVSWEELGQSCTLQTDFLSEWLLM